MVLGGSTKYLNHKLLTLYSMKCEAISESGCADPATRDDNLWGNSFSYIYSDARYNSDNDADPVEYYLRT